MIERYSDHAANERTFLAWVRTAIAIMAFGFLVEKFDLFVSIAAREMADKQPGAAHMPSIGGQTLVGPAMSSVQLEELAACIEAIPWQWVGPDLPQFPSAPTSYGGDFSAGGVGLRLFTVAQRGGYAPMLGGLGYVLAAPTLAQFYYGGQQYCWYPGGGP